MNLITVLLIVFLINIPFGYWRENSRKFSLHWLFAIHLPVPFIILLRAYGDIGFEFITYPVMIAAFFFGQLTGTFIYRQFKTKYDVDVSGCIVMDLYRKTKG